MGRQDFSPRVIPARDHILTIEEALEPLFSKLATEAEVRLVAEAVKAGWPADEAAGAIDALRRREVRDPLH